MVYWMTVVPLFDFKNHIIERDVRGNTRKGFPVNNIFQFNGILVNEAYIEPILYVTGLKMDLFQNMMCESDFIHIELYFGGWEEKDKTNGGKGIWMSRDSMTS